MWRPGPDLGCYATKKKNSVEQIYPRKANKSSPVKKFFLVYKTRTCIRVFLQPTTNIYSGKNKLSPLAQMYFYNSYLFYLYYMYCLCLQNKKINDTEKWIYFKFLL